MFPFNRLSIQSRLILLLLTVSLGSILVVAWIGYASGTDAITRRVDNHLQGVRAAKTAVLKKMLETTRNEVVSMSDEPAVIDAMREFREAWEEVKSAKVQPEWDAELRQFYEGEFLPPPWPNASASTRPLRPTCRNRRLPVTCNTVTSPPTRSTPTSRSRASPPPTTTPTTRRSTAGSTR
jgi:hypothetical protein